MRSSTLARSARLARIVNSGRAIQVTRDEEESLARTREKEAGLQQSSTYFRELDQRRRQYGQRESTRPLSQMVCGPGYVCTPKTFLNGMKHAVDKYVPSWGNWKGLEPIVPSDHTYLLTGQALGLDSIRVLVDDKANRDFVSYGLLKAHLRSQDGENMLSRGSELSITLQLSDLIQQRRSTSREMRKVDIILGIPWLREFLPKYDWSSTPGVGKVYVTHRGVNHTLDAGVTAKPNVTLLDEEEFNQFVKTEGSERVYLGFIKELAAEGKHDPNEGPVPIIKRT